MIDELEIQGFRCFHALTANPLGRVNLLVGENNAGKSAFLDAGKTAGVGWDASGVSQPGASVGILAQDL